MNQYINSRSTLVHARGSSLIDVVKDEESRKKKMSTRLVEGGKEGATKDKEVCREEGAKARDESSFSEIHFMQL